MLYPRIRCHGDIGSLREVLQVSHAANSVSLIELIMYITTHKSIELSMILFVRLKYPNAFHKT